MEYVTTEYTLSRKGNVSSFSCSNKNLKMIGTGKHKGFTSFYVFDKGNRCKGVIVTDVSTDEAITTFRYLHELKHGSHGANYYETDFNDFESRDLIKSVGGRWNHEAKMWHVKGLKARKELASIEHLHVANIYPERIADAT